MPKHLSLKISNMIIKLYQIWPFNRVPAAKIVNKYLHSGRLLNFKYKTLDEILNLEAICQYFIIPIEKRFKLIKIIDKLYKKYGIKQFGNDTDRLKEQFDNLSLSSGGWSNLCYLKIDINGKNGVNSAFISVARVEESLLLVTIKSIPSEKFKYKYYQAIKMQNKEFPILYYSSIKGYIKSPGFTDYLYNVQISYECDKLIDCYKKMLNKVFKMLTKESLIIAPLSIFICYIDGPLAEDYYKREHLKSWNRLGLIDGESSIIGDDDKKFYLINKKSIKSDTFYCFVDKTKMLLEEFYSEYCEKIFSLHDDMQIIFVWNIIKDSITNRIYSQLNDIRADLYENENGWEILKNKYLSPYGNVIKNKYIFERIFENNGKISEREAKWFGISTINIVDIFSNKIKFTEYINKQISYKTNRISKIIKDITFALEGYKSIRNDRSNLKIQIWLFALTIITVLIGLIQIVIAVE